jgi:hypothetical protein
MGDRQRIHRERLAIGAIYGTVVYVTILVLLEEDRTDPKDAVAILVGTALVFWLAHVYAHLVPRIAATGRLRTGSFLGLLDSTAGLRAAIAAGILSLAAFASGKHGRRGSAGVAVSGSPQFSWPRVSGWSGSRCPCTDEWRPPQQRDRLARRRGPRVTVRHPDIPAGVSVVRGST